MTLRFGTDGIRGVANAELSPELVLALGRAAARHLPSQTFLVGRDTRRSGPMLAAALSAGLASAGSDVIDVGVIPTPGLAYLAQSRRHPAAMISASHNPYSDNGIKLLAAGGTKLADATEAAIEDELDEMVAAGLGSAGPAPGGGSVGEISSDPGAVGEYEEHLAAAVHLVDPGRMSVVIDCANGAASDVAPRVFGRLGVRLHVVSASPDGTNINDGCGSTHPEGLVRAVLAQGADLGLAFDGDADRLIAVGHDGAIVDGDRLIALFAQDLRRRGELDHDGVVVTVMSNFGLRAALEGSGITVVETPVGDRSVVDAMALHSLVLGGEQSGHIVFKRHATTGDGILTGLKLVELVVAANQPLATLAAAVMQRYPQELRTVAVADLSRLGSCAALWAEVSAVEGRLGGTGRVLVRASGTEPAVRVMVQAQQEAAAAEAVEQLAGIVRRELGGTGR